jgi:adenine C2-methylase RlmN of 23S rRNA A2503 and tRNA A37
VEIDAACGQLRARHQQLQQQQAVS